MARHWFDPRRFDPRRALQIGAQIGGWLLAAVLVWLFTPSSNHFRDFDPAIVGRDESNLWRDYYEHRYAALATGLTLTENRDFGLSPYD